MSPNPTVVYATDRPIDAISFADVLRRSTLGERRPIDDAACLQGMVEGADLTVTAWVDDVLVGVARSVTDFHYACYLSDLAVDAAYQRHGIGRRLIELSQQALGPRCTLILLAAPAARDYYPRLGFDAHPSCWTLPRDRGLSTRSATGPNDEERVDE